MGVDPFCTLKGSFKMAKLITLQLLVRDDDEQRIKDGLRDMLMHAQTPVDPDDLDAKPWLATWAIHSVDSVNAAVDEALAIGGDDLVSVLETEFVICFAGASLQESFYSSLYGPTSLDRATKFSAASVREALGVNEQDWQEWSAKTRAYVTQAPYGRTRYVANVMVPASTGGAAGAEQLKTIEFWADGEDHAREKIEGLHGSGNIVSVRSA